MKSNMTKEKEFQENFRYQQTDHGGQKCESCEKSFSLANSLKRHIHNVHESHKIHNCESCSKSFARADKLKKHIHTVLKATRTLIVSLVANHFPKMLV